MDLDVNKLVKVEESANLGGLVVLHVEIENVQHRLHDAAAVVLLPRGGKVIDLVQMLACEARCQLHNGHGHGECGALDGHKRLVHVEAHGVCDVKELLGVLAATEDAADDFDQELLGVSCAEVEADGLEDEAFQANDDLAGLFKDLVVGGDGLVGVFDNVCCREDVAGLFDGVFDFAGDKERG